MGVVELTDEIEDRGAFLATLSRVGNTETMLSTIAEIRELAEKLEEELDEEE